MLTIFKSEEDLDRAYSRLVVMAAIVVLTLLIAQMCRFYGLVDEYVGPARVLMLGTLVVHFEFFIYVSKAFRYLRHSINSDVFMMVITCGVIDVLCFGLDLIGLGGHFKTPVTILNVVLFTLLAAEITSIIVKLEKRITHPTW